MLYIKKGLSASLTDNGQGTVLDVGRGFGGYAIWIAKKYHSMQVIGLDTNKDAIKASSWQRSCSGRIFIAGYTKPFAQCQL